MRKLGQEVLRGRLRQCLFTKCCDILQQCNNCISLSMEGPGTGKFVAITMQVDNI
jgi:hypothetical protein